MMRLASNANGQMTIEMVLLVVALFGVMAGVSQYMNSSGYFKNFVERPADRMRGMIESGVWMPSATAKTYHPNLFNRRQTTSVDPSLDQEDR